VPEAGGAGPGTGGAVFLDSVGGVAASHPEVEARRALVAPATGNEFNAVRATLIPIACWRVDNIRFLFDSAFVNARVSRELRELAGLRELHPGAPLSIFGHADPVGDDEYNKKLSGRRAQAIYGLLIRDVALWEEIFDDPTVTNRRDADGITASMLDTVGFNTLRGDGSEEHDTEPALRKFQTAEGLPVTGKLDRGTRRRLIERYMDAICRKGDNSIFKLQKSDFLAQGADPKGKGDFQGCSEFNPVLIFSQKEQTEFAKASDANAETRRIRARRNVANAPNRHVVGFLYRPGTRVDPGRWPCPRATEGPGGCHKRFFSDGESRRTRRLPDERREFSKTRDTFACRFFHIQANSSPCTRAAPAPGLAVAQITAKVPGTKGIRDPKNQLPENVLKGSTTSERGLVANPPAVLVRGCTDVELTAVTTPPNQPVNWSVEPNENTEAPPTITPFAGGTKSTLRTNKTGSFSVVATLGATEIVWNVVFVFVKVDIDSAVIVTRDSKYVDNGSDANQTRFRSGEFKPLEFAWEARVRTVDLIGGGAGKKVGVGRVELHILQNGVEDTLTGTYDGGATALEDPIGGLPIRDSNGAGSPFMDSPSEFIPPNNALTDASTPREVFTADSPAGSFPRRHPNASTPPAVKLIRRISGVNGFRLSIASISTDAPNAIVVHAQTSWEADYAGDVNHGTPPGPVGRYSANGAATRIKAEFTLVSEATGGQDAGGAGFETFEPRFNAGTNTIFTPPGP
jgi:hypothetical protein